MAARSLDPSRWWWRLRGLLWVGTSTGAWVAAGVWFFLLWVEDRTWGWLTWSLGLALGIGVSLMEVALIGTWVLERRGRVCVDCGTLIVRAPDPPDVVRLDLGWLLGTREPCPVCVLSSGHRSS